MREAMGAVLRKAPLSTSLTEKELQVLALRAIRRQFPRRELLFGEGDPCTGLFVVSPSGRGQVLAVQGASLRVVSDPFTICTFREVAMELSKESKVKEIALSHPGARQILENAGVDYCRGGDKSLRAKRAYTGR